MSRWPGKDTYRVLVRNYYDYDIHVQAGSVEEALAIAEKTYGKDHKILSAEKFNYWEIK